MKTQSPGEVVELITDNVYALGGWEPLESERLHWVPEGVTGWQPFGAYLLVSDDGAVLIQTGPRRHGDTVIGQLLDVLSEGTELKLLLPRVDLMTTGNLKEIAHTFNVTAIHGGGFGSNPLDGLNLVNRLHDVDIPVHRTAPGETLELAGFRFEPIRGTIKQTTTFWMYETVTRGFFAAELFCHTYRPDPTASRILDSPDGQPPAEIEAFTLRRFPWIPGARSAPLQKQVRDMFSELDVAYIAPEVGCVLRGEAIADNVNEFVRVLERNEAK